MENIKVSIVVPIYNSEKYLVKCLDSLANQTLKEIEIICVNDGSKDNSLNIIKTYSNKDKRFVIINQENQGMSAARNAGMKFAKGEYIGFVDSDDWVDLNFYEKLYNSAKQNNCEIAAGDIYRQGKILKSKRLKYKNEEIAYTPADKYKKANIPTHNYVWNKIYKRESLNGHEFPLNMYYEDIFWLSKVIYDLNGFVIVPNVFYYYRKIPGSIVTQKSIKTKRDFLTASKELYNFMNMHNIPIPPHRLGQKDRIKLFGKEIIKAEYYYPASIKYKLFGFINILEIERFDPDYYIKTNL